MEDEDQRTYLRDQHLVRLFNKTLGLNLSSNCKGLDFYGISYKPVIYHDPQNRYEKMLSQPVIEQNRTETVKLSFNSRQERKGSILATFRVIKLCARIMEYGSNERANIRSRIIDSYMENLREDNQGYITRGEPILLKSEVNDLYLGVKKFNKQHVLLSTLDNPSCEFVFILETKGGEDERISIADSFQVKSLLGGSLTLNPLGENFDIEELIYNREEEKIESEQQLLIEETLERTYSQHSLVQSLEPVNNFVPVNYSLKFFSLELLTDFERTTTLKFGHMLEAIVNYHLFLQYWGCLSGKLLKSSGKDDDEDAEQRLQEENLYYDYEEASETSDKLMNNSNLLLSTLRDMQSELSQHNFVSSFGWKDRLVTPDLALKIRQKALLDLNVFDYLFVLIKLILQKTYQSLDFEKIFNVKHDTEAKREVDSSGKRNKLKRLLFSNTLDWRNLRQTPQSVCRPILDKILSVALEIVFFGVKNNPENVRAVAPNTETIYYLYSFFKPVCRDILLEISKFMVYPNEDHIVAWISKVEILGERKENIEDQITVLRILNNFCSDFGMGKDCLAIQKRIRIQLFNIGTNAIKRGNIFFQPESDKKFLTLRNEEAQEEEPATLQLSALQEMQSGVSPVKFPSIAGQVQSTPMPIISPEEKLKLKAHNLLANVAFNARAETMNIPSALKSTQKEQKDLNASMFLPLPEEKRGVKVSTPGIEIEAGPMASMDRRPDQWTKCIVKICKPAKMRIEHFAKRIPYFEALGFKSLDQTRFTWDMLIKRPEDPRAAASYDMIITHINQYIQLMIKMSESMNDESLNQVKNIGLTEELCLFLVRNPEAHPKVKTSLLQLYMKLHISPQQRVSTADQYSYSFKSLNRVNLLGSGLETMNWNINKLENADMNDKKETEKFLMQLISGEYCLRPGLIGDEMRSNTDVIEDYLDFIGAILTFAWHVVDLGYTDHVKNNKLLLLVQEILEAILERRNTESWYCVIIAEALKNKNHAIAVRKVTNKCLDLLILLSKVRANLLVLAYLRLFKESHDNLKKFRCQISFLHSLFEIYNFNLKEEDSSIDRRQGVLEGIFMNKKKKKQSRTEKKVNQIIPGAKEGHSSKQLGLLEQIDTLRGYKYPFMDILIQIYYGIASTPLGCDTTQFTEYVMVNSEIQSKVFSLINSYYLQKERFSDHVDKVLLFVGIDELLILSDFDGESKASGQQVVSVTRLKEKIEQILLDEVTIQNQLQNISNSDNKHRRILEFTNIINKMLGKFAERLFKPRLFQKTQDLLRILNFHEILMEIFKLNYQEKRHEMMMKKTLRLFEYFIFNNPENMRTMIPHCQTFVDLIDSRLPTSRVLSSIFTFIQSTSIKQKIIKTIFEKVYKIAENPDIFILPIMKPQERYEYSSRENSREKLIEYFRVMRTLMVEGRTTNKKTQQLFVENLIFCFSLSKNLLPSQLELFVMPEVKAELDVPGKDRLLNLLIEFYSLVNLAILDNNNAMLIIVSLLDQASLKTVIKSEDFHPLLKVQMVRLYVEAFAFSKIKNNQVKYDKDKVTAKLVDVLGYIDDVILVKFQYSLPFLLQYGALEKQTNEEYFNFLEEMQKHEQFHFEYQVERNPQHRKKPQNFYEKPIAYGADFWSMMAMGEIWYYSYDGFIPLLIDIFSCLYENQLYTLTAVRDILIEVKTNLQNMLYAVVSVADRYPDAQLNGLLYCLHTCYKCVPIVDKPFIPPPKSFRFSLQDQTSVLEFYLDSKYRQDPAVLEVCRVVQRENLIKEFSGRDLSLEQIRHFMSSCFLKHLITHNQQIYDIYTFFDSPLLFDICLKLRMSFNDFGFKFKHASDYVLSEELGGESKEANLSRLSKRITKAIQTGNPLGRKMALREEKKLKLNANFEYIGDGAASYQNGKGAKEGMQGEDYGLNAESIFLELDHMKMFVKDWLKSTNTSGYQTLIEDFMRYFGNKVQRINPYDMAMYYSIEFVKTDPNLESNLLHQIDFYNEVFKAAQKRDVESDAQAHFCMFLRKLEDSSIDTHIFTSLSHCKSLRLEIHSLRFLINALEWSDSFYTRITAHFLRQGDELFYLSKKVFSRGTLEAVARVVYDQRYDGIRIGLCENYLEFVTVLYARVREKCSDDGTLARCDKVSFHLIRRLGEFTHGLRRFFYEKRNHLCILKLEKLVTRALLAILKVSANSLPFQSHHPFLSSFQSCFDEPLSLSNNLEDEENTDVYFNCVKICNLLLERLNREHCLTFLSVLKIDCMLKTVVLIQESSLLKNTDKLGKNLFCSGCTDQCTFYRCKEKKVSMYEKRLAGIGYELFIFLARANSMFPDKVRIDVNLEHGNIKTYSTHLDRLFRGIQKLADKFNAFKEKFHKQMLKVYKQTKRNQKKRLTANKEKKVKEDEKDGGIKDDKSKDAEKRLARVKGTEEKEDRHSSQYPLNKDRDRDNSIEVNKDNINISKGDDDEEKKSLKGSVKPEDPEEEKLKRADSAIDPDSGAALNKKEDIQPNSAKKHDEDDKKSINSADTMKYQLTAEPYQHGFDEYTRFGEGEVVTQEEFNIKIIHEKLQQSKASKSKVAAGTSGQPVITTESSLVPSTEFKDLISENLVSIFKPDELEMLSKEYDLYIKGLSEYKVAKAIEFYSNSIQTFRLSFTKDEHLDDNFTIIQKTVFYVQPHIFTYFSKETEQRIIQKILKFPPRTRKVAFLKEMNLLMINLVEYQKLYAFKELSWIVWIAKVAKFINILFIAFINLYILFYVDLENQNSAAGSTVIYTVMIISACVSAICSIFSPIEKCFIAKTYVSKFNSFKTRVEADFEEEKEQNMIVEDKQRYLYWYDIYVRFVLWLHRVVTIPCTKYIIAIFHYDNLVQFAIFYLGLTGVISKTLFGSYISLALILIKTSTLYKLYTYLSVNIVSVFVYLVFILVLMFAFGVYYFLRFRDSLRDHNPGIDCDTINKCMVYAGNYGLFEYFGYTERVATLFKDNALYYERLFLDTLTFETISFFTVMLILIFIIIQLNTKRLEINLIKDRIKKECLICGIGKAQVQKLGIKWKEHIYEEHNFRKMVLYTIYLLDKPRNQCNTFEANLKDKIVNCEAEFFDELKIDRKQNRLELGITQNTSLLSPE